MSTPGPKSKKAENNTGAETSISALRSQIDQIDLSLLKLLDQRAGIVKQVGELKKKQNRRIHDPSREQEILAKMVKETHPNLLNAEVKNLFQSLISFFRTIEAAHTVRSSVTALPNKCKVGFLGFGLIGASIGLALKNHFSEWTFLIVDPNINPSEFEIWCTAQNVTNFKLISDENLKACDFVFLCAPISINDENAVQISKQNQLTLNAGSVLTDYSSVYGFHPLTGKEQTSFHSAQDDLFFGKTICLTNTEQLAPEQLSRIKNLVSALGANAWIGNTTHHNEKLAHSSHLIQVLAMAFGASLTHQTWDGDYDLLPTNAKNLLRLTGSSFEMWAPIFEKNKFFILKAIEELSKELHKIESNIKNKEGIKDLFTESFKVYQTIYHKGKST